MKLNYINIDSQLTVIIFILCTNNTSSSSNTSKIFLAIYIWFRFLITTQIFELIDE